MYTQKIVIALLCLFLGTAMPALAQSNPEAVADAFHNAITFGDATAVEALLAPDVAILEGHHAQTSRRDYMEGHMKDDMAFMPYMTRTVADRDIAEDGNIAWVVTLSHIKGSFDGKDYDFASRELLVMRRTGETWQITLVHWSDH